MKKKFKLLAIILTVLITVLCLPVNALASDISDPEENSSTEVSSEASESSVETTVETETMIFEFTEDEAPPINSRMIGGGGEVDFGPPEEETTTRLSDGVYAIENFIYPGIWMDATASSSAGAALRQSSYTESPLVSFTRSALFKIRYVSETNSYIIRLMTNNLLSIEKNSNYFYTTSISPYDKDHEDKVSALETFTITYSNGGYIISPYNNQAYAICSNGSVAGDSNGSAAYLRYQLKSTAGNNAKWKFHKYTGAHKNGTILYYTSSWKSVGIPVGTTGTMSCKTWTTKIGANTPYKRVAADSSAMISTSFNFDTNKMSFEALSPGKAKIYSMILEGTSEPSKFTAYSYFQVIPREGTCLIRNIVSEKFIDIEGHTVEENAIIQQFKYGDADWLRWCIEHVSGGQGYVRIKSKYSNKYIGVDSTDTTVIKQTSAQNDYTLWKFERTASGNIKLVCKAIGETKALSIPSSTSGNGANLTMATYTEDDTFVDEWILIKNRLNIEITFDQGYIERHRQPGESDSVVIERISNNIRLLYYQKVSMAFDRVFGIDLNLTLLSDYVSDADLCPKNGLDGQCNCLSEENCALAWFHSPFENNSIDGFEYSCHCTNFARLRNKLIVNIPEKTFRVTYSGHKLCYNNGNQHNYNTNVVALSDYTYPIVCSTVRQDNENPRRSTLVLFHELLHTFGVYHHESNGEHCVMDTKNSNRYNDIVLSDPFDYLCEECALIVIDNFDKY